MRPCFKYLVTFSLVLLLMGMEKTNADDNSDWSYEGDTGPEHWHGYCMEKSQSPVDLDAKKATKMKEPAIKFVGYDKMPEEVAIKNVGSTIKLHVKEKEHEKEPQISGGGLSATYQFAQLHFHWGETDNTGSEHTINEAAYPMELHLVHYNTKYGEDLASAISGGNGAQDTLAVLGILYKVQLGKPNPKLEPIITALDEIKEPGSHSHTKLFALQDLLPASTQSFFRYNGSLTTPGCNEIVVWTVFKDTVPISNTQMDKIRSLGENSPNMKHNFRPVQPLNGRTVYQVETSGAVIAIPAVALITLTFSMVFLA